MQFECVSAGQKGLFGLSTGLPRLLVFFIKFRPSGVDGGNRTAGVSYIFNFENNF